MFDHVEINVGDLDASRRFFAAALAPLGYEVSFESPELVDMRAAGRSDFGLVRRDPVAPSVHLAFEAPDRTAVDAFHAAALAAGGTDNGPPGLRPGYGDTYYAAFVIGPDGHNVEAVTKRADPLRESMFPESDLAAIRAAERALAQSFDSGDPTAWVDFYTDDALFVGPGAPALEGRGALLAAAPHISISSMEIEADSTLGGGDFAATHGRATWVNGPRGSDGPRVRRRFLMVWRREADGAWRIARELLNEDV